MTSPPTQPDTDHADVARNVAAVRERIATAARRAGRDPASIRLLAVTKTVTDDRIRAAVAAGCTDLGENKVQEAVGKAERLADLPVNWSIIGHLQSNKAKQVAAIASEFQALDSRRVAEALDRRLQTVGRSLDVLIQVNTSGEDTKFGLRPDDVAGFLSDLADYGSLRVRGLMTLAELTDDHDRIRRCFTRLRDLRDRLRDIAPDPASLDQLSMGMSGDYELAIAEGSTVVRVGQAIFGARPTPDRLDRPERGPTPT